MATISKFQKTLLLLPVMFFISFFLLINKAKSEFSLNFATFKQEDANILSLTGDATISNGVLQLTKKDSSGRPAPNTVGRCRYAKPVRLYDRSSGRLADFTSEFRFVTKALNIDPRSTLFDQHADGLTFFIASPDFHFPPVTQSSGGFLGLFTNETAFNPSTSKNHIVLVEFDSFTNEWDPYPQTQLPHMGLNVNSIRSVELSNWEFTFVPEGMVATARITYDSKIPQFYVSVSYPSGKHTNADSIMYDSCY